MTLQVLVATMHQTDHSLLEKMNIQSDAIVVNQCNRNEVERFMYNGHQILWMLAKKLPMSKLAEPLKIYPQVLENVRVTDKKAAQDDEAVQVAVKAVAEALGDTGRILVRESGTEPVVRVMVEAPDHDTCQKYMSYFLRYT